MLVFVALLSAILAGFGLGVYLHTKASLDGVIRRDLVARADDVAALWRASEAAGPPGGVAQVLSAKGRLVAGRPRTPALAPAEAAAAARRPLFVDRTEALRLYARPGAGGTVVVAGVSLHQREHALESLATALLVGGPLFVLLAGLLAYRLVGAAFRPIEEMRLRASAGSDPSARLPLPEAHDEVRRLGETLNEMLARVEASVARERTFVANASHQLRTPVALLRTELDLARTLASTPEELRDAIAAAISDADRLSAIVSTLLLLARAEEGALPVAAESIDVRHLLEQLGARYGVAVEPGDDVRLIGDRQLVDQALASLVENALAHGGGGARLWARRRERGVELHVTDDGCGFAAEFIERAFERFAQDAPAAGGAGLGLALARALAQAQGGDAGVANRPEGGADAWISLPPAG